MFKDARFDRLIWKYVMKVSRINPKIEVKVHRNSRSELLRQTYSPQITKIAQRFLRQKK